MTVFIAYGWPEGRWHSKQLRKALADSNYTLSATPDNADIIIAHSAGCYMLPPDVKARLILLIGLPNWPRPLFKCTIEKIRQERKNVKWLQKTAYDVFYAISQPTRLYRVYVAFKKRHTPNPTEGKVLLLRNEHDTYMAKGISENLANAQGWLYQNLKGQHDDLWENPQVYLDIINKNLK